LFRQTEEGTTVSPSGERCRFMARSWWARGRALGILLRQRSLLEALEPLRAEMGDVFLLSGPGLQAAVIAGADPAREALVTLRHAFSSRLASDPIARWLRGGMLVADGAAHDTARRMAEPFFRADFLRSRAGSMLRCVDRAITAWPDGAVVELSAAMRRLALEILLETLFDLPAEVAEWLWDPLQAARAYIAPGLWLLWPGLPRPGYAGPLRQLEERVRAIIRQRRSEGGSDDLLSAWVRAPHMGEEEVRDQMMTMLIAGHDTVGAWLAWTLAWMAWHPEIQALARQEVDEQLHGNPPDPIALGRLPFLQAVGYEALRLFPPIPVLNRRALIPLTIGGVPIPPGMRVMISIYTIHRHPGLWEDPGRFDPARFMRRDGEDGKGFRYLPFGGGPRFCIGAPLAKLEGFLVMARMLQRVIWEPVPPAPRPRLRATLDPWPGVWVRIRRRG